MKKIVKKSGSSQSKKEEKKPDKSEKEIMKPIGTYHDFLIYERKDRIKEPILEFENPHSDNNFINEFLILNNISSKPKKSRFTELFKELSEKEQIKEEPEIENNNSEIDINIDNDKNINSYDKCPSFFSINNNQYSNQMLPNNNINNINNIGNNEIFYNNKKKFPNSNPSSNSNSNANSRSTSFSTFTGHDMPFSHRSTISNYSNNYYKTSSSNSIESNYMNNNMINFAYNNNNNNNIMNNMNNINNINNMNNINNINNINNNNYFEKEFKDFEPLVNIKKVLSLEDKRTTIMIKNIPNKFTREKLIELIDKNFQDTYDLFLLPKDGNKNRNFGYAFINFISSYSIPYFYYSFNGKKWSDTNSLKVCEITYSKIQGRNELISHYPNKIIFFNDKTKTNKFFIPNVYKEIFKQIFPNQKIEENEAGFYVEIP